MFTKEQKPPFFFFCCQCTMGPFEKYMVLFCVLLSRQGSRSCGYSNAKMRGSRRTAKSDRSKPAQPALPLSSAAQLQAPARLPHLTFSSSDEKRRKPPARAASRSTKDRKPRSALLAPAVDWKGHPAPQSRPERPRDLESKSRASPAKCDGAPSVLAESVAFWRFYHATSA